MTRGINVESRVVNFIIIAKLLKISNSKFFWLVFIERNHCFFLKKLTSLIDHYVWGHSLNNLLYPNC